ncbi:putative cysteine peptidase [Spiroplasma cantharicola]|uniref:Peptidase C39-like domain-containing protein n=1 Tax=Spiroplasma cantharicola TaxID=362837 RepID=A0A0M4KCE0_9MOLU|nr:hypothetical protein [Spiroplasma cantharicola]ALD66352.1 hypothetical protein SCANT_v1c04460 [Spiroplasma cantharicola]
MKTILRKWLPKNTWKNIKIGSSTSTMHSSSSERWLLKYKVPVLFSFVINNFAHNVVIYGYAEKNNEYAVHFGWGGEQYSKVIMDKDKMWSYFGIGF